MVFTIKCKSVSLIKEDKKMISKFIEKYIRIIVFSISFILLYSSHDIINPDAINNLLSSLSIASLIIISFLIVSMANLISSQDCDFIKIAKTSGAYQMLLKYIHTSVMYCVISILFVVLVELFTFEILKIIALSVCFGSLSSALLAEYLYIKLLKCNV